MNFFASPEALIGLVVLIAGGSILLSPRARTTEAFFAGSDAQGNAPGLLTLVFSQVTTWIFARSLLTAAILGYYYGVAGALAYTAYYMSFLTGMVIISRLRKQGARSLQDWLRQDYGRIGVLCYNTVIALRLMSEVFANLIVVGLVVSFVISFYFSVNTIIYSLMRNMVDNTPLEEIYTDYDIPAAASPTSESKVQ